MLSSAHQGYLYQDILGAYFVAQELALGKGTTKVHFDHKKTPANIPDKFDDLTLYYEQETLFIQVKYSNEDNRHVLTKQDFSSSGNYDLALYDLFATWKELHSSGCSWRVCLAWDLPKTDDPIIDVLIQLPDNYSFIQGTICYKFDCDALWPVDDGVLPSWRALRSRSSLINRKEFQAFLDDFVLEVNCPKSTLLHDYNQGLEKLLARAIERIGIGIYPNDHLSVRQVAEALCTIAERRRSTNNHLPISCNEIAQGVNILQTNGGVEQDFSIDESILLDTPQRIAQVVSILEEHRAVVLTGEPGAGKSWFIENLQNQLQETTQVIKHYCYIALEDPLALKRITVNVLYGSLITQILQIDEQLGHHMTKRYASNLEQLNILLGKIENPTLLIIDGIDHIWRVYQKNRGGLTEDETRILEALAQLDLSNPKVSIMVISQPIEQLTVLDQFYHCTLAQLPEAFVEGLIEKHGISNTEVEEGLLSEKIHEKSNGNALYCKYLIDHAIINKANTSVEWLEALPHYDFNLTSYYQYLYEQIRGDASVPNALCGADFSLMEDELKEITHLGNLVSKQLIPLRPILRYVPSIGYSIYHESFKRFIINKINEQGASIDRLIYSPLIDWLEQHSFFESTKAYGHLLKLYYEIDDYESIAQTISLDFLDNSLFYAQPFNRISQNHNLQKAALRHVNRFAPMIVVAEQSKIVYELEHTITDELLVHYFGAVQQVHGRETMYRALWDGETLSIDTTDALRFLVNQAYLGEEVIHWSMVPSTPSIPYEILGFFAVELLHTTQYDRFDDLVKNLHENPDHIKAFQIILNEVEWWRIHSGDSWMQHTPYFRDVLENYTPSVSMLEQAIERIISDDRSSFIDSWEEMVRDIVCLTKSANADAIAASIHALSNYNWFRNWLIYLIKITDLSQKECDPKAINEAFTYLVRDLEPFKGTPRTCDLYTQIPFIEKTFHWGLLLCGANQELLIQCCELLEMVTNTTTSLQRSYSGPLTDEKFLEIIGFYLPSDYVLAKYDLYYAALGARRVYADVAETAFKYATVLGSVNKNRKAEEKYREGVQALTAYGFRKDRTLSEILYSSVPYQHTYGTLSVEWFYELYQLALAVVTHTDGKSTSSYPIEWFREFSKVYPDEALRFLATETLANDRATWHQEEQFLHVLEECDALFEPTQWFLLCRSLPIASTNEIIRTGLSVQSRIDALLQDIYKRWLQSLPSKSLNYPKEIAEQYSQLFDISLEVEKDTDSIESTLFVEKTSDDTVFPINSLDEALAFIEANGLTEHHAAQFVQFLSTVTKLEEKQELLREVAKSFKYGRNVGEWVTELLEQGSPEWIYFNVCLFVFVTDGWFRGLHFTHHLNRAYQEDPLETLSQLREVLGHYLSSDGYASLVSCNLITALSELQIPEESVRELLDLTTEIVQRRLPNKPDLDINQSIYQGLDEFNREELMVALLISRFKTLTTEKSQGIIWSLTYIAQTNPRILLKPFYWAFSHHTFLLPIHRAVLLQILSEYIDSSLIPDELIAKLIINYPSGYFLEDQYTRSFVDYRIDLDENAATFVSRESHPNDKDFLIGSHIKYRVISKYLGILNGSYKAYAYARDNISKEFSDSYYIRADRLSTSIVPFANAAYEIVNRHFYAFLKELTLYYGVSHLFSLEFYLEELVLQIGSLSNRPSSLPTPQQFPPFETRDSCKPIEHNEWIILAAKEKELFGESFEPKNTYISSITTVFGEEPTSDDELFARYLFRSGQYSEPTIQDVPFDQPICTLGIWDTLERAYILYLTPFAVRELGLQVDKFLHGGFIARDDNGNIIVRLVSWRENYVGEISSGTEVPLLEGAAVMIREDYYNKLLTLYDTDGWIVLSRDDDGIYY